jgi:uncharacterized membrane protein
MHISEHDRERISAAIHAAEEKTSGEIVCVLAQASSDAIGLPILLAALGALALPWLLVAFTALTVHRILLLQAAVFFVAAVVLFLSSGCASRCCRAGAPRRCPSRRLGAVRHPRHRPQEGPQRHPDFRLARRALCPHRR